MAQAASPLPPPVARFAELVRAFAAALEAAPEPPRPVFVEGVADLLAQLISAGYALPDVPPVDDPPEFAVTPPREAVLEALGPHDTYRSVFDPFDEEGADRDEPASERSLADDLLALFEEWVRPLHALEAGHAADAAFEWRFSMRGHGGRVASAVLHALQALRSLHLGEAGDPEEGCQP